MLDRSCSGSFLWLSLAQLVTFDPCFACTAAYLTHNNTLVDLANKCRDEGVADLQEG
jgi:hypothetical protein